jgi:putative DNA primase/helicase
MRRLWRIPKGFADCARFVEVPDLYGSIAVRCCAVELTARFRNGKRNAAAFGHPVFVVEGEAKADALAQWNIRATCNAEGAGKWTAAHAAHLRGAEVIILPDNDKQGRDRADAVAQSLQDIAKRVRNLELPGLAPKCDIVNWQKAGHTREELDALIELAVEGKPSNPPSSPLESAAASTFEMRSVRWLWGNRFALGKLGLIGGLPDRGKRLITANMIARTTKGDDWPCGEGRAVQGNVLVLTAEDDIEDTVVPRLVAAGANLDRVIVLKMVRQGEGRRMFSLVTDLALLRQKIEEVGGVVLIVIDPMSAYLGVGKIDSFRTTDVRGVLSPLTDLAAEKQVAIIGVVHFDKKADVHNAMLRISDSLAFVATARHCYVVVDDAENERRLFVKAKNNLAPDTKALSYSVGVAAVGQDDQTKETIWAPHVLWGSEHVNVSATEAMENEATAKASSQTNARDTAKKFLSDLLAEGPVAKRDVEDAADANCISTRTLERAKAELGIVAQKAGLTEGWMWHLPEQKPPAQDYN